MKDTINPLLGQAPKKELVDEINRIVTSHPLVYGIHDMIIHDYGPGRLMVSLHAEVSAEGDMLVIHDQIDHIEHELQERLNCAATIHMDPIITDDEEVVKMRNIIHNLVKNTDPAFDMHDFRMVKGPTHTNLIFDVVVPYNSKFTDVEILRQIKKQVNALPETKYHAVIQIDREYC